MNISRDQPTQPSSTTALIRGSKTRRILAVLGISVVIPIFIGSHVLLRSLFSDFLALSREGEAEVTFFSVIVAAVIAVIGFLGAFPIFLVEFRHASPKDSTIPLSAIAVGFVSTMSVLASQRLILTVRWFELGPIELFGAAILGFTAAAVAHRARRT